MQTFGGTRQSFGASPPNDPTTVNFSQDTISFDTFSSLIALYGFTSLDRT
jgi:hypothetical protein